MPWWLPYLAGAILLFVGLAVLRSVITSARRLYHLLWTSLRESTALAPGDTTAVHGTVEPLDGQLVDAHVVGGDAVMTRSVVERYEPKRYGPGRRWDAFHRDYDAVPFVLRDDAGEVVVRPPEDATALSTMPSGVVDADLRREVVRSDEPVPERIEAYAQKVGNTKYSITDTSLDVRVGQGAVRPGDEVYVTGDVLETPVESRPRASVVLSGRQHPERFRVSRQRGGSPWGEVGKIVIFTPIGAALALAGAFLLAPSDVRPVVEALWQLLG